MYIDFNREIMINFKKTILLKQEIIPLVYISDREILDKIFVMSDKTKKSV